MGSKSDNSKVNPYPQLTTPFLEKILKAQILDFSASDGCQVGDNAGGSILKRIQVDTTSDQRLNLIYKTLPPPGDERLRDMIVYKVFPIEHTFYSELTPLLRTHSQNTGFEKDFLERLCPKFHGGLSNTNTSDYILMEDLRPEGYRMPDKLVGLNEDELSLILKELARFHALTYSFLKWEGEKVFQMNSKNENSLSLANLDSWSKIYKIPNELETYKAMIVGSFEAYKRLMRKRDPELASKMDRIGKDDEVFEIFMSTFWNTDKLHFPCIIHGDLWINNILIKYDSSSKPESLKFIDFQQVHRGNIYEDLSVLIYTSTTPQFRREHLQKLLNSYYETFTQALISLNTPPPLRFTRVNFLESFKLTILPTFIGLGSSIPLQMGKWPSPDLREAKGEINSNPFEPRTTPSDDEQEKFICEFMGAVEMSYKAYDFMEETAREMVELNLI